jgi:transcriptional regulator with XRE-family HTH domain
MQWHERAKKRMEDLGLTASDVARRSGLNVQNVWKYMRGQIEKPRGDALKKIALVLNVSEQWILFGDQPDGQQLAPAPNGIGSGLAVLGEVAAGAWLEYDNIRDYTEPLFHVSVSPHSVYPVRSQYGLLVKGTSINRIAREGDILHCVDIATTGIEIQDGDLVIVERRKAQGLLREVTAKKVVRRQGRFELWPDSDDPRWQEPFVFDQANPSDDETEVIILARVDNVIRSLRRPEYGVRL